MCDVDLFVTRLNQQPSQFVSWRFDPFPWAQILYRYHGPGGRLCLPTFCPDQQSFQEGLRRRVNDSTNSPSLRVPAMVSGSVVHASRLSDIVANPQLLTDLFGQHHPLVLAGQLQLAAWTLSVSRRHFRRGCTAVALWMEQRYQQYIPQRLEEVGQLVYSMESRFSVYPFLDFLASQFFYRTDPSTPYDQLHCHIPMGQHPLMSWMFKGMYNSRPPQPPYTSTWDVDILTQYLASLGDNTTLSFKQLSHKLAILMALVGANRVPST